MILFLDNDAAYRDLVVVTLAHAGHHTVVTGNAAEAVEVLVRHGPRIKLLITDPVMAGLSGATLARLVRQLHSSIAVILASGRMDHPLIQDSAFGKGVTLLGKPFTSAQLLTSVHEELNRTRQTTAEDDLREDTLARPRRGKQRREAAFCSAP